MASVLVTIAHPPSAPVMTGTILVTSTTVQTTQATATSNQYDNNNGLRKISTIMPAFLIGFVCFLAIFLACGMYHSRRRRRMRQRFAFDDPVTEIIGAANEAAARQRKKKKRVVKPKLWEVDVKVAGWERDLEALLPVAVELQHEPKPSPPPSPVAAPREPSRRRWFFEVLPRTEQQQTPRLLTQEMVQQPQQAQVAFIVSMPAPNRLAGQSSQDIVLGTTQVPYRHDADDDVEEPAEALARKLDEAIWISRA